MPLPKNVDELKALLAIAKKMSKLIASKSEKTGQVKIKKENVRHFEEYATDASTVMGSTIASRIRSLKKSMLAAKPKATVCEEKAVVVLAAFDKFTEKVKAQLIKVKESEEKRAKKAKELAAKAKEVAKAKAAAAKAKEAAKAKAAKTKDKKKPATKRSKKSKSKSKSPKSPKMSSPASYMWGGDDDNDSNISF